MRSSHLICKPHEALSFMLPQLPPIKAHPTGPHLSPPFPATHMTNTHLDLARAKTQ